MRGELDTVLRIIQENEGANSDKIQRLAAAKLGSLVKAQNRLRILHIRGEITIKNGWRVYTGKV